jgi:predicted O-methyltransferase YrrM
MKLPEVRDALHDVATQLDKLSSVVAQLAEETRKRRAPKKAPAKSKPMTDETAELIRAYARKYPTASQFEIGKVFGVNQGRVSEVLRGKRK